MFSHWRIHTVVNGRMLYIPLVAGGTALLVPWPGWLPCEMYGLGWRQGASHLGGVVSGPSGRLPINETPPSEVGAPE